MRLLILFALISVTCVAQESKKGGLEKIQYSDGKIYHKVRKSVESFPTTYYKATVEVLSIYTLNNGDEADKQRFIVVEGNEVIGGSSYSRSGLLTIEQAKTLLTFLQFVSDSILSRAPINNEEIVLNLSDDFQATVFNTNQTVWKICFTVHSYHRYNIYFKQDTTMEIARIISAAIKEAEKL